MPRPSVQNLSDLVGHLFPTTQTGSYPRPGWFRAELGDEDFRVAMRRADYAEQYLDATRALIGDQLQVGIDVPTDGHLWWDPHQGFNTSFLHYPAQHLDGITMDPEVNPIIPAFSDGLMATHGGTTNAVRVTGPIGRGTFRAADLYRVAQSVSPRTIKYVSGMGPATIAAWLVDLHYQDRKALYRDLADAYNQEFKDVVAAGARILQLDDVGFSLHAPEDYPLVLDTLNRALDGVDAFRIYHICHLTAGVSVGATPYGLFAEMVAKELEVDACEYALAETGFPEDQLRWWKDYPSDKGIGIGVIDIKRMVMETPEQIVAGVRTALRYVEPERIHLTTDCGMFSFPRVMAKGKLAAMCRAAEVLRAEFPA